LADKNCNRRYTAGRKARFTATQKMEANHLLEKVGKELREMMSWLQK
jgi:ketol-acid reductoisomerase